MNNAKIRKVVKLLKMHVEDLDYISPNYVADVAFSNNVKLTSEEVVYISDNLEDLINSL